MNKPFRSDLLNKKPKPYPYLPMDVTIKFANETMRSITAPWWQQCVELEMMMLPEED